MADLMSSASPTDRATDRRARRARSHERPDRGGAEMIAATIAAAAVLSIVFGTTLRTGVAE
jgi:hypothetical protein